MGAVLHPPGHDFLNHHQKLLAGVFLAPLHRGLAGHGVQHRIPGGLGVGAASGQELTGNLTQGGLTWPGSR